MTLEARPMVQQRRRCPRQEVCYHFRVFAECITADQIERKGNMPVTGNGPNTLRHLQQVASKRSQGQLSNVSAPPSTAPRIPLSVVSSSRPNTSAGRSLSVSRPKSAGRGTDEDASSLKTPVSPNTAKKYGPYRIYKDDDAPPTPRIPEQFSRARSIDSNASKRNSNYVDLLDLQSGFKTVDFHSRVQAAGARNYGEDVAERNLTMYTPSAVSTTVSTSTPVLAPAMGSVVISTTISSHSGTHTYKRVSVIPEDSEEGREQEEKAVKKPKAKAAAPTDPYADPFLKQRKSFGELSADNSSRRSKPPAPLTFRPAVANYEEIPDGEETPQPHKVTVEDDEEEEGDTESRPQTARPKRSKDQRPRTATPPRGKNRQAPKGRNGGFNGAGYDTTEDEEFSSPAPSPIISRHNENIVAGPPPKANQGWKRTHGPTYRELASSNSRPNSMNLGKYPQRTHSLSPSVSSVPNGTTIQPPSRTSSLAPWPPAPDSPTTVSSMQSGQAPFSPPKSQYTTATSVDEHERYTPPVPNGHGREKPKGGSLRQRDYMSGSSYTAVPEDRRYSTHSTHSTQSRQYSRGNRTRRDTLESHGSGVDDMLTTDGSDFETYLAKRQARRRQEDAALLWYEENGITEVGKSLPGLFDGLSSPAIPNWSGQHTPRLPSADRLHALLASRYHKEPPSASRKAYTARLAKALLDQYAEDFESEAGMSEWDPEEEDLGPNSRDKALRLLASMKEQGLNILDLLDMEETLKERERQDARVAMRLRKEMKKLERLQRSATGGGSFDRSDTTRGKRPQRLPRTDMRNAIPEY